VRGRRRVPSTTQLLGQLADALARDPEPGAQLFRPDRLSFFRHSSWRGEFQARAAELAEGVRQPLCSDTPSELIDDFVVKGPHGPDEIGKELVLTQIVLPEAKITREVIVAHRVLRIDRVLDGIIGNFHPRVDGRPARVTE
jgi:hypothetical protein